MNKRSKKNLSFISRKIRSFEKKIIPKNLTFFAGVDEVGRGCIAGPVVAAAVIFPINSRAIPGVFDSKQLSKFQREDVCSEIYNRSVSVGIGLVENTVIDKINIHNASIKAMKIALDNLKIKPEFVLIDAIKIPSLEIPQKPIIKGDEKCYSVAAASIVAKVWRDSLMTKLHDVYPHYDFKSNKGYFSRNHVKGIKEKGLCEIHRFSFSIVKKFLNIDSKF
jgi:ribonuclease HII